MKRRIALILGMAFLFQTTAFAIGTPEMEKGVLDHEFNENRTFYNVYLPDGVTEVPEITASGAVLEKKASGVTDDFGNDRITVLKDSENGKLYRFKFLTNSKKSEITEFSISSTGLITVKGNIADGKNIKTVIYAPTEELSEISYSPATLTTQNSEKAIAFSNVETKNTTDKTYQLSAEALSGMYRVVLAGNGVDKNAYAEKEYYYLSENSKKMLLKELSEITSIDGDNGLTKFLEDNGTKINIDFSEYNSFSDKSVFLSILCGESFEEKPDDLIAAYEKAKLITKMNLASGDGLLSLINENEGTIGLDMTLFDAIENKTFFKSLWKNSGADSYEKLAGYFKKVSAAALISESDPESLPENLLKTYKILGITDDTYNTMNSLLKYDDFMIELSRTEFSDADDVGTWITANTTSYKNEETAVVVPPIVITPSYPSTGGGGGGGGFSSSASSGFKTDVIPEASYEPETEKPKSGADENPFTDIESVPWAKEAIILLEEWEIINGVGDGKFDPLTNVTREQFVHMIVTAFSISGDVENVKFNDVDENAWYYNSLKAAMAKKIITGITSKEFGTGKYITRQDMAVILDRVATFKATTIPTDMYPDKINDIDKCAEYAKASVTKLTRANIMTGSGDGNFAPDDNATRAMAAVVIYRMLKLN